MKNRNILVTGGAGFVGSNLTRSLANLGANIIVLDNQSKGKHNLLTKQDNIKYLVKDLNKLSESELLKILSGIEILYHLAAEKHSSQNQISVEDILSTNISATYRLFQAASKASVKKIVFTSSLYAYGRYALPPARENDLPKPDTLYGISKLSAEHMLRQIFNDNNNINYTIARLFFVYGPGIKPYSDKFSMGYKSVLLKHFQRMINNEAPIIYGSGQQGLDYIYIDDVVKALILCAGNNKSNNKTLNISTGKYNSILDLTQMAKNICGFTGNTIFQTADKTDNTIRCGDNSLASETLDWTPNISIEHGLKNLYEWIIKNG